MSKAVPLDLPTRKSIDDLFRSLLRHDINIPEEAEYQRLYHEVTELREKLLSVPQMKKLEAKLHRAADRRYQVKNVIKEKVRAVQRLFQSRGLTSEVRVKLTALVNELERRRVT